MIARKINREIVAVLGWGRAILLQFAHPLVAAGIADHSGFNSDQRGYVARAHRTVAAMLSLTFGSEEEARKTAARINAIHDRVHGTLREAAGVFPAGTPYSARDPELLRWVHATLLDSVPLAYERFVGPLTVDEKDRYCREAADVEPLLRIPDGFLPRSTGELNSYMHEMYDSGQIVVTDTARELARNLLSPPFGTIGAPLFSPVRLSAVGLLPPHIRAEYGMSWDAHDERALARATTLVRTGRRWLPRLLREWPTVRRAA